MSNNEIMEEAWKSREPVTKFWIGKGLSIDDAEDCFMRALLKCARSVKELGAVKHNLYLAMSQEVSDLWRRQSKANQFMERVSLYDPHRFPTWAAPLLAYEEVKAAREGLPIGFSRTGRELQNHSLMELESILQGVLPNYRDVLICEVIFDRAQHGADYLGITVGCYKTRLYRGLKQLEKVITAMRSE